MCFYIINIMFVCMQNKYKINVKKEKKKNKRSIYY